MARIDENQEAVARIRMLIENAKLRAMSGSESESESEESQPRSSESEDHWVLGSPISSLTDTKGLANELVSRGLVQNTQEFQSMLFNFLGRHVSPDCVEDRHIQAGSL